MIGPRASQERVNQYWSWGASVLHAPTPHPPPTHCFFCRKLCKNIRHAPIGRRQRVRNGSLSNKQGLWMRSLVSLTRWRAHQWVSLFQFPIYFACKHFNGWISMKSLTFMHNPRNHAICCSYHRHWGLVCYWSSVDDTKDLEIKTNYANTYREMGNQHMETSSWLDVFV